ncbi:hypothetical protein CSC94_04880 [Zhengella mangrovi]|uniref:PAS fold-4 domain-containing protein n=2 Tax=Zhengella mangrovi TaxID=1982044 RepID=A0A2G1QR69_9HYPH|nr:hypothetical protein CSC94_04880 [Zhengella mangrovi]
MTSRMCEAIWRYQKISLALRQEFAGEQNESVIRTLDRELSSAHERIETLQPADDAESYVQIRFFLETAGQLLGPSAELDIAARLINERLMATSLERLSERVSLIDSEFRYVKTSFGNREFYQVTDEGIIGRHVAEVIGQQRFEGRARHFFERAFSGQSSEYFHLLEQPEGTRIMRCAMEPLRSEGAGAVVTMQDVTDAAFDIARMPMVGLATPARS